MATRVKSAKASPKIQFARRNAWRRKKKVNSRRVWTRPRLSTSCTGRSLLSSVRDFLRDSLSRNIPVGPARTRSRWRGAAISKCRADPRSCRDGSAAVYLSSRCPDHEGIWLQHCRRSMARGARAIKDCSRYCVEAYSCGQKTCLVLLTSCRSLPRLGMSPRTKRRRECAATVRADIERWAPIIKASGFVAD